MSKRKKATTVKPKSSGNTSGQLDSSKPVRVQISTSDGSEIAAALEEICSNIPSAFQKSFNLGAYFREVLQANDTEIASMLRKSLNEGTK